LNVLNRGNYDIDYAYTYRQTLAVVAQFEDVFHPVEPVQARVALTARF